MPAPRKPVTMVQGTRARTSAHSLSSVKIDRRHAGDQPALERLRGARATASARRRRGRRAARRRSAPPRSGGVEPAEHIGPGAIARMAALRPRVQLARQRTRCTVTPVPSAARGGRRGQQRARARLALGIAGTPAGDADIDRSRHRRRLGIGRTWLSTRGHPRRSAGATARAGCHDANRPAPRHPARRHDRIDGRSPGSRVAARHRLPGIVPVACGTGSPLTVAGAAADLEPAFRTAFPVRSLVRDRRSRPLNGRRRPLSMPACRSACGRLSDGYSRAVVERPSQWDENGKRAEGLAPKLRLRLATLSGKPKSIGDWGPTGGPVGQGNVSTCELGRPVADAKP